MPNHKCGSSGLCLHDFVSRRDDEDNDFEFVEVDPSRRYGRYKEVLGKGACKTVYRAFDEVEGIEVAWNQVKVQDVLQTLEDLERLYSEVHLLKTLKHKNIIKLYHSWVDTKTKNVNFITEIFTSGTLRQYRKRHRHVDIKAVKNWSRQILRGLLYLHSHDPPIIHRDLKCDNIFVNGNQGEVKIGDLGLATILRHAHAAHSVLGTPEFMAPELYEEEYTELVDIYSFGMCLLEMVTSEYPYSECTNAAQIYKKVTSGTKPEALNKVKDPELRQFIDKCLAVASMRLSARELMLDPFLQTGGDHETIECLPVLSRMPTYTDTVTYTDDMDDLGLLMGLSHVKSASVKIRYRQNDTSSNVIDSCSHFMVPLPSVSEELHSSLETDLSAAGSLCESMVWHHPKEGKLARSVDFRVKGKLGADDSVFLRLRITDSEGCVQYIDFPFYVEVDTAMCVASEMVAALDFTDQDVTKIAEMIDAAILAVVPEWKPGVAIDEGGCGEGELFSEFASAAAVEDKHSRICGVFDPLSTVSSESSLVEQSSHGSTLWCDPSTVITADTKSIPPLEGTLHGRFEEVTYHRRPDFRSCVAPEQCTFSSDSSGTLKVADEWDPTEDSTSSASPVTNASVTESESTAVRLDASLPQNLGTDNKQGAAAFNKLVESKRKAGLTNYRHETWEGIVSGMPCIDHQYASSIGIPVLQRLEEDAFCQQDIKRDNFPQFSSAPPSVDMLPLLDDDDDNDLIAQEIRQLSLRHEQELRELHRKHEEALLELRTRWWQKKCSSAPRNQQSNSCRREAQVGIPDLQGVVSNEFQAKECQDLATHDALHQLAKRLSEDVSTETQSDSSLKGLRIALSHVEGLGSEGVGYLRNLLGKSDNISNMGKMSSSSALKVAEWVKSPSALGTKKNRQITSQSLCLPKTGKKSSYQSVATRGQTYMKPEPGIVCIPVRPEVWEQIV